MREGVSRFSVENFLSHSTETFLRGTLPCFRKILVSKFLMLYKGGYHDFPSRFLLSDSTETFRRGTLVFP